MDQRLLIGLAGDVMIGRTLEKVLAQNGYAYAWGNLLPLLNQTDLNIVNLETTLTRCEEAVWKTFNFRASPDKVKTLAAANIRMVNLANNHILDFTETGLLETISTLDDAGILHVGAGVNSQQASAPVIIREKNLSVGVLGFTDNEPGWKAGEHSPGVNYIDVQEKKDRKMACDQVRELKQSAGFIIVSIHWGPNMQLHPPPHFCSFAHELIDNGADLVHGHSAHNFQGIELYKGKLICYDTGDFVDDYVVDHELRNDHSFFFRLHLGASGIEKFELIPVLIADYQVNLATGDDYTWSLRRMRELSAKFQTRISDDGIVDMQFAGSAEKSFSQYKT